jgi:[ribosomal protein S18]-alanine N-acetyltransferase
VHSKSPSTSLQFLELKPLTQELLPAVLVLDQACFGGLWTFDGYQRELESPNSEILVLPKPVLKDAGGGIKDEIDTQLIGLGCFWAILEEAHITILAVHPNFQRQGLGQWILCALLQKACDRGLERATLEVRISNQVALTLYQKFGFREAGRRRRYYQDTGEDALILWRSGLQRQEFQHELQTWQEAVAARLQHAGWHFRCIS